MPRHSPTPLIQLKKRGRHGRALGTWKGIGGHGRASQGIKHLLLYLLQLVFHLHHDILHLSLIAL